MAIANNGNNVIVDGNGVALAGFTNAAASNIKIHDATIYSITSGLVGSNANGSILLAKLSGALANLDSRHIFIALRCSINGGSSTDAPIANLALSVKGATIICTGSADYPEITAPMIGDAQTKIIYRANGVTWNSIHPGTNLQGSQFLFEAGGDAHLSKHPLATVKDVVMRWYSTSPSDFVMGMPPTWGSDNKPATLNGLRFISINGNTKISLFAWNQPGTPSGFPNQAFDVRPDYIFDVAAPGTQPTAIKRSYRRSTFTAAAASFWGNVQINDMYLWIDPITTLSAVGVLDSGKTYLRTVDYNNIGTQAADNNVDIVAFRFKPTLLNVAGMKLANASVVVINLNSNCSFNNVIGTYRAKMVASGITDSTGLITITEPATKNYSSNASHRTDSFVGQNRIRTQAWHKWWEVGTKMIVVSDSRNGLGTTAPELYGVDDYLVSIRRIGSVFYTSALDMSGPQSPTISLSEDVNYNNEAVTSLIVVSYDSETNTTTLQLPDSSVSLDAMHKALVDFHGAVASNEGQTFIPFNFEPGIFSYGSKLIIQGTPLCTIVAGAKIKTLKTTITSEFNTADNPKIAVPYIDALGSRVAITGLDSQGFGVTWHLRFKKTDSEVWTAVSGTGNSTTVLSELGEYDVMIRVPGYDWKTTSFDTNVSLTVDLNLQYQVSANNTPQYTMAFDEDLEATIQYDAIKMAVSVENTTGAIIQPGFAEIYQATQRIQHIPALVWVWTHPVTANATSQKILIPDGNPISFFLTESSNATVKVTCPVIHLSTGQSADDRVKGNSDGYSIILGSPATAESAGLQSAIVSELMEKLGGAGYSIADDNLQKINEKVQALENADFTGIATTENVSDAKTEILTAIGEIPETDVSALALEATSQSIKTKVDALENYNDTTLIIKIDAIKTVSDSIKTTVEDKTGYSLTTNQVEAIAVAVETHLLDEGDTQKLIEAIVNAIGNANIDEIALIAAIRSDLERTGGKLDAIETTVDLIENYDDTTVIAKLDAVKTKVDGLNNYDDTALVDKLDEKPTLAQIEASDVLAKEATVEELATASGATTPETIKEALRAFFTVLNEGLKRTSNFKKHKNNLPE